MSAFDQLSPALQHQIVGTLRIDELRPVQEQAIPVLLAGHNAVLLAPTAGGKTEAAFFPALSRADTEDWKPVSILYLSPIRALLNNQNDRVEKLSGLVGRRGFTWHGDITQSPKRRFLEDPTDVLLTTPESLEAMMMSTKVPTVELFAGLQLVIVDEVHAFASDARGAHLSALLERLVRKAGRDVQRVGLSATVGNPKEILRWLQGSSKRDGQVVDPGGEKKTPKLRLDHVQSLENAALMVDSLYPRTKRLVFVESRKRAEELGEMVRGREVPTFVSHGSLSVTERRDAEEAFHHGNNCVIVATSALELGIDVGDLDHVLQVDSPNTVASFLQRMGRTGRREGQFPNCSFLAIKDEKLLQAAALLQMHASGFVEHVRPLSKAAHIYAHQLMAIAIEHEGIARDDAWKLISGAGAFQELTAADRAEVEEHMLRNEILADHGGRVWLGPEGERTYGRANFRELYAVFEVPRMINVRWNQQEIGTVDGQFLAALDSDANHGSFLLAGKPWEILDIDWQRAICVVRPAPLGKPPRWQSGGRFLSFELCQGMRQVLTSEENAGVWTKRTCTTLRSMRAEFLFLHDEPVPLLQYKDDLRLWTFAGGGANLLLARMLEHALGGRVTSNNLRLNLTGDAAKSDGAVRELLREWCEAGRPDGDDLAKHAEGANRSRLSKFEPCLPERLLKELVVRQLLDVRGARALVGQVGGVEDGLASSGERS